MRSPAELFDERSSESAVWASAFKKLSSYLSAARLSAVNLNDVANRSHFRSHTQTKRQRTREDGRDSYLYLHQLARGCNIWGPRSADLLRGELLLRSHRAHDNGLTARPFQFAPQKNSSASPRLSKRPLP